jgi:hypothetical protein
LPTTKGKQFYSGTGAPPTHEELAEAFSSSESGRGVTEKLKQPVSKEFSSTDMRSEYTRQFRNPWYKAVMYITRREFTTWKRNSGLVKSRIVAGKVHCIFLDKFSWKKLPNSQSPASIRLDYGTIFRWNVLAKGR